MAHRLLSKRAMKTTRTLVAMLTLMTAACVAEPGDTDPSVDDKADRTSSTSKRFTFDAATSKCVDGRKREGLNAFVSTDAAKACTDFRGHTLAYAYLRDRDLRGSVFGNNNTYGGSLYLDRSDLRGARFEALMEGHGFFALEADLRGADLSVIDVMFTFEGSPAPDVIVELMGATFDDTTRLPTKSGRAITREQAVAELGMVDLTAQP